MINQEKSQSSCHRIEQSELSQSIVNPTKAHHKYEKTTNRVLIGGWFSFREDSFVLFVRISCMLFCCAFWYGAYRLVKMFLL
jgi:hypothetical protein